MSDYKEFITHTRLIIEDGTKTDSLYNDFCGNLILAPSIAGTPENDNDVRFFFSEYNQINGFLIHSESVYIAEQRKVIKLSNEVFCWTEETEMLSQFLQMGWKIFSWHDDKEAHELNNQYNSNGNIELEYTCRRLSFRETINIYDLKNLSIAPEWFTLSFKNGDERIFYHDYFQKMLDDNGNEEKSNEYGHIKVITPESFNKLYDLATLKNIDINYQSEKR